MGKTRDRKPVDPHSPKQRNKNAPRRAADREVTIGEARANFADIINRVNYAGDRITLKRRGKLVAAIVPVIDLEFIEELENRVDIKLVEQARRESDGESVSFDELMKELGIE